MIMTPLKKTHQLLTQKQKKFFYLIIIANLITAGLEMISIGYIPILISVLLDTGQYISYFSNIEFINNILSKNNFEKFLFLSAGILLIFIFKNIFFFITIFFEGIFLRDLKIYNANKLYNIYVNLPLLVHYNYNTASLQRNIIQETSTSVNFVEATSAVIRELFLFFGIISLLLLFDPIISITSIAFMASLSLIYFLMVKKRVRKFSELGVTLREYQIKNINQLFSAIKETKILNTTKYFVKEFIKKTFSLEKILFLINIFVRIPRIFIEIFAITAVLTFALIYLKSGYEFIELIPLLGLLVVASVRLIPSFNSITSSLTRLKSYEVSIDIVLSELKKYTSYLNKDKVEIRKKNKNLNLNKSLKIEKINFTFPSSEEKVIKDCNFEIKRGERIGLVGSSGSGKTTLINMILGFIKPQSGKILVDGIDIHSNLSSWHSKIGFIPQEIYLLDETITKNVALGLEGDQEDLNKVKKALISAEIYDFINKLPEGLDTNAGEKGIRLSGGQRQRIGIARALYRDPSILIFDEATSSLDSYTEEKFMNNVFNLGREKTMIISTHKLNTLKGCDKIYLLDKGEIVQTGDFSEIINKNEYLKKTIKYQ